MNEFANDRYVSDWDSVVLERISNTEYPNPYYPLRYTIYTMQYYII